MTGNPYDGQQRAQAASRAQRAPDASHPVPRNPGPLESIRQAFGTVDGYHPGGNITCPVAGCGWALRIDPPTLVLLPDDTLRPIGAPVEQVEWYLACHAQWHADTAETGVDAAPATGWDAP
jgi:hypothetical protein